MSKSIVVIETPCTCRDCIFIRGANYEPADKPHTYKRLYNCVLEPEHYNEDGECCTHFLNEHILEERKPEWCPLRPVPEKMDVCGKYDKDYYNNGGLVPSAKVGWNMCVDYILGRR